MDRRIAERKLTILSILLATLLHMSHGCQMENVIIWAIPVQQRIRDTFSGTVLSRQTTNIEGITSVTYGEAINRGPYFDIRLEESQFVMSTNEAYSSYEEYEVAQRVSLTVDFRCTGGGSESLIFWIDITDTNNNPPRFIPTDEFEFVVTPPLPPGFLVTGCLNDIIVRDIDLTTQRIDFTIEDNPHFEIEYDASSSTVVKEFHARLRTTTFIRTISEPITLNITATDVDQTNDPPLSTTTTVRIIGDTEFQFPEEPRFYETFYLANYTEDHQLNLLETIALRQGFDEYVNFALDGEYAHYFSVNGSRNQVLIEVETPLPDSIMPDNQFFLIIRADREYTSGDSATIIVNLPEEEALQFERVYYEGTIENNSLKLSPLVLSQGYGGATSVEIVEEHSNSFTASVTGNLVTLTMGEQIADIIEDNDFITLQVVASNNRSSATTVVNLGIIKDDNVTPVFDKPIYDGTYAPDTGLTVDQITMVQGFDDTVAVDLKGEHANFFQINQSGTTITLTSSTLPLELYSLRTILIVIEATKPRTVGANAVINIALPEARELAFEDYAYRGSIDGSVVTLETILLSYGYEESVNFNLSGEYANYFALTNTQDRVTISLSSPLPGTAISQNSVIILTLTASGPNAVTTTTSILLDVIKDDTTTPVFTRNIYYGMYSGATVDVEAINLVQGFDNSVSFRLYGAHSQYFDVENNGSNVVITLQSPIPEDVIFNEKVLLFSVLADKALTVGAHAVISIRFPSELTDPTVMRFSQNTYIGALEENVFTTLEDIVLDVGFANGTEFILSGEYASHFDLSNTNNVVQISSLYTLPHEVIEDNDFIVLDIEARRQMAVSVWASLVVDIVKQEVIAPVFGQAYYKGVYTEETGLIFDETIYLSEGYDETVSFSLSGDSSIWFSLDQEDTSLNLVLKTSVPAEVLQNNNQLLFTVIANKTHGVSGRSVISIDLPKDFTDSLRFVQDFYKGYIENNTLSLEEITLEDYTSSVNYSFSGEYADYFQLTNHAGIFTLEMGPLLTNVLEQENLFLFTLEAQTLNKRTHTNIILENIRRNYSSIQMLEFEEPYYIGEYSPLTLLQFDSKIRLTTEMDSSVTVNLDGADSQWFGLERDNNSVTVTLTSPIPVAVLANNQQLVFVVTAQRPGSVTARATVVISLVDSITEGSTILGFDRISYLGSIENNQVDSPVITLREGFTQDVVFTLHGDLSNYFNVTSQGAVVTIALQSYIPEQSLPTNGIIMMEIQASAPQAATAYATVVIGIVEDIDESPAVELIFGKTFYDGSYSAADGLLFPIPISLTQGYDSNVDFVLEGGNAQWFGLERDNNSVTVTLTSPIPVAVLANNQQLVFVVTAQRRSSATARATVVISLVDNITEESTVLGFDRISYLGSIENNQIDIPVITLLEGFTQDVVFTLHGDLSNYFNVSSEGAVVTIALQSYIPEQSLPTNGVIVMEVQASAPQAATAYATVVIAIVKDIDESPAVELIFGQTFYDGSYSAADGLLFPIPISLTQGYDSNVDFVPEGVNAQWFGLERDNNSVTVTLTSPIPVAVLANNQQLVFVVTAQRPSSATARATVVISLVDNITEESTVLGFDRISYLGSIENNQIDIPVITLLEGFTQDVVFTLHGDLSNYFNVSSQGAVVTIALQSYIPEQSLPTNGIIVMEIQASAPQAATAYATVVIGIVEDSDESPAVELIFGQIFYDGSYSAADGLLFPIPISLTQGYDSNVDFVLEGVNAQWFGLERDNNSVTVTLTSPIPVAVLANNQQLVFVITAQRPGSATARATVVISLVDNITEESIILGFDSISYLGSMENNQIDIPVITLLEGFTQDVVFTLHGDLSNYFNVSSEGAVVTIALQSYIPEQSLPTNGVIVMEVQASAPQAATAYATVVIGIVKDIDESPAVELIFGQTFYDGSYSAADGLLFPIPISLTQGYDSNVDFVLEGGNAQWFGLERDNNSVTVTLTSPIPVAVLANNQQLVFVVTAQRPGSAMARATVVIALVDNISEGSTILGFDRISYLGSIENNHIDIPVITLIEGFTQDVVFTLHGDLSNFFNVTSQGAVVTIALQSYIPEQSLPTNGIIMMEIQASAPQAATAYATVVIGIVKDIDGSPAVELIFGRTFYEGSYSTIEGISFPTPITLTQGYDSNVDFTLEGVNAQWFGLERDNNSVTVTLTSPIPVAVLTNNQHLVFVVTAQRFGATARATIVISLDDEIAEGSIILGFDRVSYLGSIENNQANISEITLSEGFTEDVVFTLHGDLSNYFRISPQGAVVTISLQSNIPEQSIPASGIIVLNIQASAPLAVTAYATIVINHVVHDSQPGSDVNFEKVLFQGFIQNGVVNHEIIIISGFSGSNVELVGEYSTLFIAALSNGVVTITAADSFPLPSDTNHVALEIRAGTASAVLLLDVIETDAPSQPTVSFSSPSYAVRIDVTQTGLVGQVQASADNGEAVTYSLQLVNAHLEERLSINSEGELHLSAPTNSGAYVFVVVATTIFTQTQGNATVHLSVDAITVCGDELVMPPLIVLDLDEEESHYDLINGTRYDNCHFTLSNRWPLEQSWLYVDETGLHTSAIDREHESIAFMPLSQVQVEVTLICDSDSTRTKRSLTSLGPYDYGTNKWVLTDTIHYNSRRSLVNVIVNDINDNAPIFVGKENEPIVVGYPVPELAERVLPRSLAELQATDADIGENAALVYWSSASELAVSPTSGFVHLRNGATLDNGVRLTIEATDRNGEGLTGSLDILVRLLDENYIAVVTIRNAFLDDELSILSHLTEALGYEVKVLRSVVISTEAETNEASRKKRDVSSAGNASLQLYVYGLVAQEPVSVDRLTTDISNTAIASVIVESTISLQDHLEAQEICVIGRDIGLLVATIVLAVLLFIALVAIAVWFFLRWRKNKNYDQFSDVNSLASKIDSTDKFPRPEAVTKPRLDIGELKKSERRLQEMLDAPVQEVSVEPVTPRKDAILDMPIPEANLPIVIQSIDKLKDAADESTDDEFGEVRAPKRKSVVTFNENVEKIIHVEDMLDSEDLSPDPDYEIYKL